MWHSFYLKCPVLTKIYVTYEGTRKTQRERKTWEGEESMEPLSWIYKPGYAIDCQKSPGAGWGEEGFSPRVVRDYVALLKSWFWTSSLQNNETINFCCFKTSQFWYFIVATLRNKKKFVFPSVQPLNSLVGVLSSQLMTHLTC